MFFVFERYFLGVNVIIVVWILSLRYFLKKSRKLLVILYL